MEMPKTLAVTNPADRQKVGEIENMDRERVFAEMKRVRRAAIAWSRTSVEERCERIHGVRKIMADRMDEIAEVVCRENGKVMTEALFHDVGPTMGVMTYFCEHAPRILAPERLHLALAKHRNSYIAYRPKGVIGIITPWNFPFFMPGSDVAMALIAGNGVLLKPSEVTPLSALILKECYDQGGIDPDLFRVVTGLGPTGAALIEAEPDHVVFTGAVVTGKKIAVACAERLIPCTLELGGKAPALVLEDADLERTANAITWGGFANAGQVCASVERVYAVEEIYDAIVREVSARAAKLRVGPSHNGDDVDVGAITFPRQIEVAQALLEDAKQKGARVVAGGGLASAKGAFFQPTVLADCTHEMKVMKDEIFGPIVPIMKVGSEREAIERANDSHLGLGAYVFTRSRERGRRVAEQIEAGSIMVNDVLAHAGLAESPWGGIKSSGMGVVRSDRGLRALCHARHINEDRLPMPKRDPFWFPYSSRTTDGIRKFLEGTFGDSIGAKLVRKILR